MTATYLTEPTWPLQSLDELLLSFASDVLAHRRYKEFGRTAMTFDEWKRWEQTDPDSSRAEDDAQLVRHLIESGLLSWPKETRALNVAWHIDGPSEHHVLGHSPGLDWVRTFGYKASEAIAFAEACALLNKPCRLSWTFHQHLLHPAPPAARIPQPERKKQQC